MESTHDCDGVANPCHVNPQYDRELELDVDFVAGPILTTKAGTAKTRAAIQSLRQIMPSENT